jgi:lipoprotein signal peptidase
MILLFIIAWHWRRRAVWFVHGAFALVVAGALGNVTDRLARGFVVDFIHLRYWPIFNVADVCVTIGGVVLFAYFYRSPARTPAPG